MLHRPEYRREFVATLLLVNFLLSQWALPTAMMLPGGRKAKLGPVAALAQDNIAPVPQMVTGNNAVSTASVPSARTVNFSDIPEEAELKAAGGFGGTLSPIGNADIAKYEKDLNTKLRTAGFAAGLRSVVTPNSGPARVLAQYKAKLERAKASNVLFAQGVVERNRRNFPATAVLFRKYLQLYPDGPWTGEARLHLAMDAKAHGQTEAARNYYEGIFATTGSEANAEGYDVRQKAKQGWTNLDLAEQQWEEAADDLSDILRTERDWRRWTWAAAWMHAVTVNQQSKDPALFACGNEALAVVLASYGKDNAAKKVQSLKPPRVGGFSLAELATLSNRQGVPMRGFHTSARYLADLPTPLIIHNEHRDAQQSGAGWNNLALKSAKPAAANAKIQLASSSVAAPHCQECLPTQKTTAVKVTAPASQTKPATLSGHFLVVQSVDKAKGRVALFDPQVKQRYNMTFAQLDHEWSGNGLAPATPRPVGTLLVEGNKVKADKRVASAAPKIAPVKTAKITKRAPIIWLSRSEMNRILGGCCCFPAPAGDLGGEDGCKGAPGWHINPVSLNMFVSDTPLWYETPIGPDVEITQNYNSQDGLNQNTVFGNKWTFNYGSYLLENPDGSVTIFMPDGRQDLYTPKTSGGYTSPLSVYNTLKKTGANNFSLTFQSGDQYFYAIPAGTASLQPLLVSIRDRWGYSLKFGYDTNVRLTTITDAQSKVTTLTYDTSGHITKATDPFGRSATFRYDTKGNLAGATDMGGYSFSYYYDAKVRMTRVVKPEGSWNFLHEGPDGLTYSGVYPPLNGPMNNRMRITSTDPLGAKEEYFFTAYHIYGTWYVDKNNYIPNTRTTNNYTVNVPKTIWGLNTTAGTGRIASITKADGSSRSYTYNNQALLESITNSNGQRTSVTYNSQGQVNSKTDAKGQTTRILYAANGLDPIAIINAQNQTVATATYNNAHQLLTVTDGLGNVTTYTYKAWGAVASIKSPSGLLTTYNYDDSNTKRLLSVTRGGSTLASFSYDTIGRVQTNTDALNVSLSYTYDNLNRITSVVYPDSTAELYAYSNCCGEIDWMKDRAGRRTQYDYDPLKRLTMVQDPQGRTTQFLYDNNGNLTLLLDTKGNKTQFTYDARNRVVKKIYADGTYESYTYDGEGNLLSQRSPNGSVARLQYDTNNNLRSVVYPGTPGVQFSYDSLNRRIRMIDGTGTSLYTYDVLGRLLSEDGPWASDRVSYSYDADGRTQQMQINGGSTTTYNYDSQNRLSNLTGLGGTFTYSYQGSTNLLTSLTRPQNSKTVYGYDALERLIQVSNQTSTGVNISKYNYAYNTRDVRTSLVQQVGTSAAQTINYGYDTVDQLTSEISSETTPLINTNFTYDLMGNRIKVTSTSAQINYTPNALNQYTSYANTVSGVTTSTALTNDANGNLKSSTTGNSKTSYVYDDADRLIQVVSLVNGVKSKQTVFVYDGFSRKRIRREYTWSTTAKDWQLVSETRALYDGMSVIQERNASNVVQTTYTRGLEIGGGIEGLLARTDSTGSYFYHYDGNGNVTQLTDSAQATVAAYTYDAFGNTTSATGTQATQPFRFSTKEYIASCGFYDYGYRFYSPATGRWINRDPIRESGGLNIYGFVANSPVNYIDADGLVLLVPPRGQDAYNEAKDYISQSPTGRKLFKRIENSPTVYNLEIIEDENDRFDPSTNTIYWNPEVGLQVDEKGTCRDGGTISPALALSHEIDHAFGMSGFNWIWRLPDAFGFKIYGDYDNGEEYRVITGSERKISRDLGEGQRHNHRGHTFFTNGPTSRERWIP